MTVDQRELIARCAAAGMSIDDTRRALRRAGHIVSREAVRWALRVVRNPSNRARYSPVGQTLAETGIG